MPPPERFGRYEVIRELGRGGMAVVYLARDPRVGREVAIKVISADLAGDAEFRRRFDREAQALARLEHSAIVPLYEYGDEDGTPYLVFRYMEGGSLAQHIGNRGALPLEDVAAIARRVGAALDYAHAQGVIHRDIKPANILFDRNGEAWLGDFGISLAAERTSSLTSAAWIGSPAYMSPEQADGKPATAASDIYSLGCTLFEAITGRPPFTAEKPVALLLKHLQEPAPRASSVGRNVPEEVDRALLRAMAKDPGERIESGRELARACSGRLRSASEAETVVPDRRVSGGRPVIEESTSMTTAVERPELPESGEVGEPVTEYCSSVVDIPWSRIDASDCQMARSGEHYAISCREREHLPRFAISRTAVRRELISSRPDLADASSGNSQMLHMILEAERSAFQDTVQIIRKLSQGQESQYLDYIDTVQDDKGNEYADAVEFERRFARRKARESITDDEVLLILLMVFIVGSIMFVSLSIVAYFLAWPGLQYFGIWGMIWVVYGFKRLTGEDIRFAIGWVKVSRLHRSALERLQRRGFHPDKAFVSRWSV